MIKHESLKYKLIEQTLVLLIANERQRNYTSMIFTEQPKSLPFE